MYQINGNKYYYIFCLIYLVFIYLRIQRAAIGVISKIQPALQVCLEGDNPYIISPLASTSQSIVISRVGSEPNIFSDTIEEDMTILGHPFGNMNSKQRKSYFSKHRNLVGYEYNPDFVYTFDFYQHLLNLSTFQIDLGFMKYDAIKVLGVRPIQVMAIVWDPIADNDSKPRYLYNFEVWHRRSLPLTVASLKKRASFTWLKNSPTRPFLSNNK
jgi:hypothetical protein